MSESVSARQLESPMLLDRRYVWAGLASRKARLRMARASILVGLLALWEFGAPLAGIPRFLLPQPSAIAAALAKGLFTSPVAPDGFYFHMATTMTQGFVGFLIGGSLGLLMGTSLAYFPFLERTVLPYIMAFQSLPKVAVAPLIIIWFGLGMESKIVLVMLLTFFPLLINSLVGFKNVDQERIELLTSLKASNWQIFWKVRLQSAMPAIFAGIEMAILFAVTGSIVGEFLGGQAGLGVLIQRYQRAFNLAGSFATIIVLATTGVLLMAITRMIRERLLFWSAAQQTETNL